MNPRFHLVDPMALVRSAMNGIEATAACGFSKIYTREALEEARGSGRKTCKDCLVATGELVTKGNEVTLHPAEGWTALLERAWEMQEVNRRNASGYYTVTFGAPSAWTFPPAA